MARLPSGTLTFLFTDIEASTSLWASHSESMAAALTRHDELLHQIIEKHGGTVFKHTGDPFSNARSTTGPRKSGFGWPAGYGRSGGFIPIWRRETAG